jgi:Flp pilus assembly pilin Flp
MSTRCRHSRIRQDLIASQGARNPREVHRMLSDLFVRVMVWFHREKGQDLIEYALVTALIAVGIIVTIVLTPLEEAFTTWVENISSEISAAV